MKTKPKHKPKPCKPRLRDVLEASNDAQAKLFAQVKPLAAEIQKLQKQLKAAGIFADDRELLACPKCKLTEDVAATGMLITCQPDAPGVDIGLRFARVDEREDRWLCPACGKEFGWVLLSF